MEVIPPASFKRSSVLISPLVVKLSLVHAGEPWAFASLSVFAPVEETRLIRWRGKDRASIEVVPARPP
jgi:hypothetical protein